MSDTVERLLQFKIDSENSLERKRASQRKLENFDKTTGKLLFTPRIKNFPLEPREKPVWEELFNESKKIKISPVLPVKLLINKTSQKITQKIRYRQYLVIFNSLSPIRGKIKYDLIDFEKVDSEMIKIIQPLIEELGADNTLELTFEEFCQALDGLIKVLTPQEKWYLIFAYKDIYHRATGKNSILYQ